MGADNPQIEKRASRFSPLEWLLEYPAWKITDWLLRNLGPRAIRALRRVRVVSILKRIGRVAWRASPVMAFVLGFIFQKSVLQFADMLSWPWIVSIIGGVALSRVYFGFWAKRHLNGFQYATSSIGGRGWDIVIGGLSKAFYDLATGLLPFWQNPWVFVVLGLYFALILDVFWMKRWFGKAVRLGLTIHQLS